MTEVKSGLRALLSHPRIYEAFQGIMGSGRSRPMLAQQLKMQPGDRVLDIGCGPAWLVDYLPAGASYVGYDTEEGCIAFARRKYGSRGQFFAQTYTEADLDRHPPFDVCIAGGLLHHLDDRAATELFSLVRRALRPGGRVITIDGTFVDGMNPIARLLISLDRGRNVRTPEGYHALAEPTFERVVGEVVHNRGIPYTLWRMECS